MAGWDDSEGAGERRSPRDFLVEPSEFETYRADGSQPPGKAVATPQEAALLRRARAQWAFGQEVQRRIMELNGGTLPAHWKGRLIARPVGVDPDTAGRWFRGEDRISLTTMFLIAQLLGSPLVLPDLDAAYRLPPAADGAHRDEATAND